MFRRLILLGTAFVVLACTPSLAAEEKESLAPLKAWVGKYPTEKLVGGKNVWAVAGFKEKMEAALGKERSAAFWQDMKISFPTEQKGDLLFFSFCKPHICMGTLANVYVNLKDNTVQVCWMKDEEIEGYWLIAGQKPRDVGPAGCLVDDNFAFYEKNNVKK